MMDMNLFALAVNEGWASPDLSVRETYDVDRCPSFDDYEVDRCPPSRGDMKIATIAILATMAIVAGVALPPLQWATIAAVFVSSTLATFFVAEVVTQG